VGKNGILPASDFLKFVADRFGQERFALVPTLCWWNSSDPFLQFLCWGGAFLSVLLMLGISPNLLLLMLWALYLSLASVCRDFLAFQWDVLLLETGFLAIFLTPPLLKRYTLADAPSQTTLRLLRWLLFRLMFSSAAAKLLSGDPTWQNLTALNVHYETQPLPTWIGWYAHQLPEWSQKVSVLSMFAIEGVVPFLIFAPSRLRHFACAAIVLLQLLIMFTGNYCFFNLLTITLCVLLIDDQSWPQRFRNKLQKTASGKQWPKWLLLPVVLFLLVLSLMQFSRTLRMEISWPESALKIERWTFSFRTVNRYGLFAVMTTARPEIILEGSDDGNRWVPYEFKYKPGDPMRRPEFVEPHQPRLDWQMWFAALETYQSNEWFILFCYRILDGSSDVLALLEKNPFPEKPPRYLRSVLYQYRFTTSTERRASGTWWSREQKGLYGPVLSLRETPAIAMQ
jgi:hypothetical protein